MASSHVYDRTKALLQGQFTPPYSVLDYDQIEPATQQATDPFLVLEEVTGAEELFCFGDETNLGQREAGILIVNCFVSSPESSNTARVLGEQVQDFMRHQRYSDIRIVSVQPPEFLSMNDGLWTVAEVSLNYQYDFHVAAP